MRILTVHNYYGNYAPGGEGNVFDAEKQLLQAHGHEVKAYVRTNSEILNAGLVGKIRAFWQAPWSPKGYRAIREEIDRFQPDIMHVHNFFMVLSPSVFRAAKDAGVPTVATLHNYRLLSPCSQLLRNGSVCEKCVGKNPWRILLYRCYRSSFWASLLRYRTYYLSSKRRGWIDDIDAFIVLTGFGMRKFVEGRLPGGRLHIKPNFVEDPMNGRSVSPPGHGAIFVGRLSKEKGLSTMMRAWSGVRYPLGIAGAGPLRIKPEESAASVRFLGHVEHDDVPGLLGKSSFIVFPSVWYEGFPCVLVESFAMGRPVVASRLGAMAEIVEDGRTGLLFEPGNPEDLREKVRRLIDNPGLVAQMGRAARQEYLEKYTPERNYPRLMAIYEEAIKSGHRRS